MLPYPKLARSVAPASRILLGLLIVLWASFLLALQAPNEEFQQELAAGRQAFERSNYAEAAKRFTLANERRQRKCSECYVWLARIEMARGSLQEALAQAEKAVAVAGAGPPRAAAELYRGTILGRQGDLAQAEAAFQAATDASPMCVECRFNLGYVLLKESRNAEGIAVLRGVAPAFAGTPRGREIERLIAEPGRIHTNYAPEFSARLRTGEEINLDTLRGKVVLLDFWGTWCGPCRTFLPRLKDLAARVDSSRVAIISIDEGDSKQNWEQFIQANNMNWAQVYDGDLSLGRAFAVDGFPRYFVLSKDGIIVAEFKGWNPLAESAINHAIELALSQ